MVLSFPFIHFACARGTAHKRLALLFLLTPWSLACGGAEGQESEPFEIVFEAGSDEGEPLGAVQFLSNERHLGQTEDSGKFSIKLRSREGASLPISTQCPQGYEGKQAAPLQLARVISLDGQSFRPISYRAECIKMTRDVVLIVHAENGARLPVIVDGAAAGHTDSNGNAHFALSFGRDVSNLAVTLDTSERPRLRPQNPRRVFEIDEPDSINIFQPVFSEVITQPPIKRTANAPRRHVPIRIQ